MKDCIVLVSKVKHSMRMSAPALETWVIFSSGSAIASCHCTCMAGLGEACSHVGAVLFLLEYYSRRRSEKSVTDVRAYWTLPSGNKKTQVFDSLVMNDVCLNTAKKMHIDLNDEKKFEVTIPQWPEKVVRSKSALVDFLQKLREVHDSGSVFYVVKPFCDEIARRKCQFPLMLAETLYDEDCTLSIDELIRRGRELDFTLRGEDIEMIEASTREQSGTHSWFLYRQGRITAFLVRTVCGVKSWDSNITVIRQICEIDTSDKLGRVPAIKYGRIHEKDAVSMYRKLQTHVHEQLSVKTCGLFINKDSPWLGGSPDRLISCKCCSNGCLEVKCPYSVEECPHLLYDKLQYLCPLSKKLKQSSAYYYQAQCQILCTKVEYCDFFVWTPDENYYHLERITRDDNVCKEIMEKSEAFFYHAVIPELTCKYYSKLAQSRDSDNTVLPKKKRTKKKDLANAAPGTTSCASANPTTQPKRRRTTKKDSQLPASTTCNSDDTPQRKRNRTTKMKKNSQESSVCVARAIEDILIVPDNFSDLPNAVSADRAIEDIFIV